MIPNYACLYCDWKSGTLSYCNKDGCCPECGWSIMPRHIKVTEQPLLTIEVKDMQSIPVVRYKGEDITGRVEVYYHWGTSNDSDLGKHEMALEYLNKETLTINRIEHRRFGA